MPRQPRHPRGPLGGKLPMLAVHFPNRTTTFEPVVQHRVLPDTAGEQTAENILGIQGPAATVFCCDEGLPGPSSDYLEQKLAEVTRWAGLRAGLLHAAWDSNCCPLTQSCLLCGTQQCQFIRCLDCSPTYVVCKPCADRDHRCRPFHTMEMWQVHSLQLFD